MFFCKKLLIARGRIIRFDLFEYILGFGRWIFMTWKQLLLESNILDYDWTFHPGSLFLFNSLWKCLSIYKCFEWNINTWACKQLILGLNIQDYDWTFHLDSLFRSIYCKKVTCLHFGERRVFMAGKRLPLGPNTRGYD